jgi:hypothetical protein
MKFPWTATLALAGLGLGSEAAEPPPHLKYFGYYADYDVAATQLVADTMGWTNVAMPYGSVQSGEFAALDQAQVKAVVYLEYSADGLGTFFDFSSIPWRLWPNYRARWDAFKSDHALSSHLSSILAFYVADEPTSYGVAAAELTAVFDLIKADFPTVPTLLVEGHLTVLSGLLVTPPSVDWVAFDYYAVLNPNAHAEFQASMAALRARLSNAQRIVVIMDAAWIPGIHDAPTSEIPDPALLGTVADNYLLLAQSDPKVIAMLAHIWDAHSQPGWIDSKSLPPSLVAQQQAIGRAITRCTASPTDQPLQFYPLTTPCRLLDTRQPGTLPLISGAPRGLKVRGACGIGATAMSIAANLTSVNASGSGHLDASYDGNFPTGASLGNFRSGVTRATNAILPVSPCTGMTNVAATLEAGSTDLLVDVSGYFAPVGP